LSAKSGPSGVEQYQGF